MCTGRIYPGMDSRGRFRSSSLPLSNTAPVRTWENCLILRHPDISIHGRRIRRMIMSRPRSQRMEGGTAAMLTSSGQATNFFAIFNICESGPYRGIILNLRRNPSTSLQLRLPKWGITATFVSPDASEELNVAFRPNTKLMFGETIANPALTVLDIELFAKQHMRTAYLLS